MRGTLSPMHPNVKPVLLRAWIDCPACGRLDRFTKSFRLDAEVATPLTTKAPFICRDVARTGRGWSWIESPKRFIS